MARVTPLLPQGVASRGDPSPRNGDAKDPPAGRFGVERGIRSLAASKDSAQKGVHMAGTGEGVPRWMKVVGIVAAVVVLLVVAMMLIGGGGFGHQIPNHGGDASSAPPSGGHTPPKGVHG